MNEALPLLCPLMPWKHTAEWITQLTRKSCFLLLPWLSGTSCVLFAQPFMSLPPAIPRRRPDPRCQSAGPSDLSATAVTRWLTRAGAASGRACDCLLNISAPPKGSLHKGQRGKERIKAEKPHPHVLYKEQKRQQHAWSAFYFSVALNCFLSLLSVLLAEGGWRFTPNSPSKAVRDHPAVHEFFYFLFFFLTLACCKETRDVLSAVWAQKLIVRQPMHADKGHHRSHLPSYAPRSKLRSVDSHDYCQYVRADYSRRC